MRHDRLLCLWFLVILGSAGALEASAQPAPWVAPLDHDQVLSEVARRLGKNWRVLWNEDRSRLSDLFGGAAEIEPATDALAFDAIATAREFIYRNADILGVRLDTIAGGRAVTLPLERAGLARKTAVLFEQAVAGLPVVGGGLTVLLDARGRVSAIHSHVWPLAELRPALVPISLQRAIQVAYEDLGRPAASTQLAELAFVPLPPDRPRYAMTAYRIQVMDPGSHDSPPEGREIWVDELSGEILNRIPLVYTSDISGRVIGYATWGTRPDSPSNPPAPQPIGGLAVRSGGRIGVASGSGHWFLAAADDNTPVTVDLHGPWIDVLSDTMPISVTAQAVPGTTLTFVLNNPPSPAGTAQLNAHLAVWRLLDFLRSIDPSDATVKVPVTVQVNLPAPYRALWDGRSVMLGQAADGAPSGAYSTVIAHELGHWLTARLDDYVTQAFAEGVADVWAMYLYDDPVVGREFYGPNSALRDNREVVTLCPGGTADCHGGDPHREGQVLAGTFWSLRARLAARLGDAAGDALADALFVAWLKAFDDHAIDTNLLAHLLVLDDDDGNLANRTPHYDDIVTAFADHGFGTLDLDTIVVTHQPIDEAETERPVTVRATITTLDGSEIASAELLYSVNGAPWTALSMHPDSTTGRYQASVPSQNAPATVHYFIRATSNDGSVVTDPAQAPEQDRHVYRVGQINSFYGNNFDTPFELGWAHEATAGTDDWQREIPRGRGGDPAEAHTANRCWGNDLVGDGSHSAGAVSSLRSPVMNLEGLRGTHLQFRRWLGVGPAPDRAYVTVNDVTVWQSAIDQGVRDDHWTLQEIDISGIADGQPEVIVRYGLESRSGSPACGWNIDDFRVVTVAPFEAPGCPVTVHAGGTAGSGGLVPRIAARGLAVPGSGDFVVTGGQFRGGTFAALLVGGARAEMPLAGVMVHVDLTKPHTLLITPVGGSGVAGGQVALPVPIPDRTDLVGERVYAQWLVFDPGAPQGVAASPLLEAIICRP